MAEQGVPWVAIPNRRCDACGAIAEVQVKAMLAGAVNGAIKDVPFRCVNGHVETVAWDKARTSSGRLSDI